MEREKQAERQKQIAKRAKTTKHWVRTAKAAGVVLVVGACVFGASMTSEANRIRLVETINGVRNTGDVVKTNNGEERKYTEEDLDKIKRPSCCLVGRSLLIIKEIVDNIRRFRPDNREGQSR